MDNKKFYRYGRHLSVDDCKKINEARNKFNDYDSLPMFVDDKVWSQVDITITSDKDAFVKYYLPEIAKGILFSITVLLFVCVAGGAK